MAADKRAARNEWLLRVLGVRVDGDGRAAGVRLAKAMMIWNAARQDVGRQIGELQEAICTAAADLPQYADLVDGVGALDDVMDSLDDELGARLSAIRATADAAEKAPLLDEARSLVERLEQFVAGDPLLADLDGDNGFLKLDIKSKLASGLGAVRAAL